MLGAKAGLTEAQIQALFDLTYELSDTTCFPLFSSDLTGDLVPKVNAFLTFDSATNTLGSDKLALVSKDTGNGVNTFEVSGGFTDLYPSQNHFKFNVVDTYAANPGSPTSVADMVRTLDGSGTITSNITGLQVSFTARKIAAVSSTRMAAASFGAINLGGVPGAGKTVVKMIGGTFDVSSIFSDAIITDGIAGSFGVNSTAGGVITNGVGMDVYNAFSGTSGIVNWKGIRLIESVATSTANSWAIHSAGTTAGDKWYCGYRLGIGTSAPTESLDIVGNVRTEGINASVYEGDIVTYEGEMVFN